MLQINGKTPVYMAAEQGQIEAVSRLIEAKCDVDKADVRPLSRCLSIWHGMSGTEIAYGAMR